MVFSSNIFLFFFLPIFLTFYYLTPERKRSWVILIGSYIFYAWWRVDFLLLFIAVTLWNYYIGRGISSSVSGSKRARQWVTVGICANLSALGYFKYANFGVATVNAAMVELGLDPWLLTVVILPIGISFYIFQAISYIIDVYRGDTPATENIIDFAAFIALFPQLIAGPVLRYKDIADQFTQRSHTVDKFAQGVQRFMLGFIKKVIIADSLAPLVNQGFALQDPSFLDAWLAVLAYTAQLYFDFSGYADMAIGSGLDDGLSLYGKLFASLYQSVDYRVLAALAYQSLELVAGLSVYPFGRQSARPNNHLSQSVFDHAAGWLMAWRQLDIFSLGCLAWMPISHGESPWR